MILALAPVSDKNKLLEEVRTMLSLKHPNVISLIGVCLDGEIPLLIMPLMSNGSVLEYVKLNKEDLYISDTEEAQKVSGYFLPSVSIEVCSSTGNGCQTSVCGNVSPD